jgi:rhodanese-related sulfurtransferase
VKRIVVQIFLLVVVSLGIGLIYNALHKPHLPLIAYKGEEIRTADSLTINGGGEESSEPMMIALKQARQLFNAGEVLFLDARTEAEFLNGHIPGAVSVSLDEQSDLEPLLRSLSSANYITYCDGETCLLSTDLAYMMVELGMEPVYVFHEGIEVWVANGLPLVRGEQ